MIIYKALSKTEFAEDAGISMSMLRTWTADNKEALEQLGVTRKSKVLTPSAVKLLAEKYQVVTRNARIV